MPYIPHTEADIQSMLDVIGVESTDALFDEIPPHLCYEGFQAIPSGLNEMALMREAGVLAAANPALLNFVGAGSYEHHIPAAVWDITSRGEYLTAYTPYQAEASQGTLQLLYEFQTMIAELTGMEVANASLYDGASALAEAVLMAIRMNRAHHSRHVLVAGSVHPHYLETLTTILSQQQIQVTCIPFDIHSGTISLDALTPFATEAIAALVISQPNFFGCLEAVDALTDWADAHQAVSIACVNPLSLGLLKPPGLWGTKGVDIACGEGQPLGIPMAFGGPYVGFLASNLHHVRQMPGRLVGKTVDVEGKVGYTLTLQAREQHIRRGKATSNICTNQGLLVTAATIYMSLLGPLGLQAVARTCHQHTQFLMARLTAISGVTRLFSAPYFHEVAVLLPIPAEMVLVELEKQGIAGGYPLSRVFPELSNGLLVCATEMRTEDEMVRYAKVMEGLLVRLQVPEES